MNRSVPQRRFIGSGSPYEELAGYSRAVVDGRWIFVSGTLGQDFRTGHFADDAAGQAEVALDTIEAALREAESGLADVVRVRVYVQDRGDIMAVSGVLKRRMAPNRPANTTLCNSLAVEGAKVEIEVTALRPADDPG